MVKVPLKLLSETPAMVTVWPTVKPCAAVVVMVTTLEVEVAVPPPLVDADRVPV